jgi:hypothetical protein
MSDVEQDDDTVRRPAEPGPSPAEPAPSPGQVLLERLLAVRGELISAAVTQDAVLTSLRGPTASKDPAGSLVANAVPSTTSSFFPAAERLAGDLEALAARLARQASELATKF